MNLVIPVLLELMLMGASTIANAADCDPTQTALPGTPATSIAVPTGLANHLEAQSYPHVTAKWSDVFAAARQMRKSCGPDGRVVMAFDLDNTIMKADDLLGSEEWIDWQSNLIGSTDPAAAKDRVCSSMDALLKIDVEFKRNLRMHATERSLVRLLKEAQGAGIETLVLTSRAPAEEEGTLHDLRDNRLDFSRSTIKGVPEAEFLPYDVKNPEEAGLEAQEMDAMKLAPTARSVKFTHGVFMTAGQNKGGMLRVLLHKRDNNLCGVVFVDNKEKYSGQLNLAFGKKGIKLETFRYSRQDGEMDSLFGCVGMKRTYEDPANPGDAVSAHSACDKMLQAVTAHWKRFIAQHPTDGCN